MNPEVRSSHFSRYQQAYVSGLAFTAILIAVIFLFNRKLDKVNAIASWPRASATIRDSSVTETIKTTKQGITSWVVVWASLEYTVRERTIVIDETTSFRGNGITPWSERLAKGSVIDISYDSSEPEKISLYPTCPIK